MPELPEVETIKLQLNKFLKGHTFKKIEVKNQKIFSGDIKNIEGAKFIGVRRFAKVTSIDLSNGFSILTHVKLTGQYVYRGSNLKNPGVLSKKVSGGLGGPHTHVIFHLDNPKGLRSKDQKSGMLYFNDIRRFGWIRVVKTNEVENEPFIKKLGPEPFGGLTLEKFTQALSKSGRPIKVVLMDQEKIGGIGNIYANDALWLSAVNPKRKANLLSGAEIKSLYKSIHTVLLAGLKHGGASELAFVTPDGGEGDYQNHTLVFNHTGELCGRCKKAKIEKYFLGGRGTYFCPICQK